MQKIKDFIYSKIYNPIFFGLIYFKDWKKIKNYSEKFEKLTSQENKKHTLAFNKNEGNVCGLIIPEIIKIISDLNFEPKKILLDGDDSKIIPTFRKKFNFFMSDIKTTGLENKFDYVWNFEDDIPKYIPKNFDLIISQAMLEHLINPFQHLKDLSCLLSSNGYLIIHSVMPGYSYHRFPIDAIRFFPDWFEYSAKKLGLKIERKFQRDFHLVYLFKKNA